MKIKILKAFNGDSILLSFADNGIPRNILIDGGVEGTYCDAENNFGELKIEIDNIKKRGEFIDLLILTHIDNDHICGLLKWFEMDKEASRFVTNVWFNSGKQIAKYLKEPENADLAVGLKIFKNPNTGVNEAIDFEEFLHTNKLWDGKIIIQGQKHKTHGIDIHIISPDEEQLRKLLKEYKKVTGEEAYTASKEKDWSISIKDFILEENEPGFRFDQDSSVKNGSSISFILTINEKNYLFLGDSHPKGIAKYLKDISYSKEKPLEVELFKVSHHGSKSNTNKELLEIVKASNYILSTDSSGHNHPNKRTLARIIKQNPAATFHFNYKNVKENIFLKQDFLDYKDFKVNVISEYIKE